MTKLSKQIVSKAAKALVVLILIAGAGSQIIAGVNPDSNLNNTKSFNNEAAQNLVIGINSDNLGLKKSCIYLAGKYKVVSAVESLLAQLKKENDPSMKILISLSLYSIGDPEGINAVKKLSKQESNVRVKRIFTEIYNSYYSNNFDTAAELSKQFNDK